MELFFTPLACSLACRIALYEAGLDASYTQVSLASKTTTSGGDFLPVNPSGQVPALKLENGHVLTEGPAVLQYIADLAPEAGLAPPAGTLARTTLHSWLNFICCEVHKGAFYLLFHPAVPAEAKAFARTQLPLKFDLLNRHLDGREWLQDAFSVADAYLVVALGWCDAVGQTLEPWPNLLAYQARAHARPAVARAFGDELALIPAA